MTQSQPRPTEAPTTRRPRVGVFAVAALSLLALVGTACSSDDDVAVDTSTTVEEAPLRDPDQPVERFDDPAEPVEVTVGQVFEIALAADAEACFSWNLGLPEAGVVTLVTVRPSAVGAPDQSEPLTAESDTDIFEFRALTAGRVDLQFSEVSPCEPGTTRDTRSIAVVVVEP
jgi:hypothetical protein